MCKFLRSMAFGAWPGLGRTPDALWKGLTLMNQYLEKNIINLAVAGHGGAGKTSLAEAMLYLAGVSDRRGKVDDGNK